ncbi:MAG TPA: rhodanese-like domain-containing protein [Syntrophales bacterium]|nr:rhodanese-like domain-containing protein [Syntrophales bacterium]
MTKAKTIGLAALLAVLLLLPAAASAAEPFVTTEWLQGNLDKVTVLDVRKVEEYNEGHIPGSINVFYGVWGIKKGVLLNELPSDDDLKDILSAAGIEPTTHVVVVSKGETMPLRTDATRVAWTLRYAGVERAAVLSGGIEKWIADKKPLSKDAVKPKAKPYRGKFNKQFLASKAHVMGALGEAVLADVRPPEFFKGEKKLDFVPATGRIKGAVNLPPALLFNADNTYKSKAEIEAIARPVVGADLDKEIIVYCDTGKVCTTWWLALHDLLGYKNVSVYDGSSMEWLADPAAPKEP